MNRYRVVFIYTYRGKPYTQSYVYNARTKDAAEAQGRLKFDNTMNPDVDVTSITTSLLGPA
jgi:hypothetical protein